MINHFLLDESIGKQFKFWKNCGLSFVLIFTTSSPPPEVGTPLIIMTSNQILPFFIYLTHPSHPLTHPSIHSSINQFCPSINQFCPSINQFHPSINSVHPSINSVHPSINSVHPSINSVHPSINSVHPSIHITNYWILCCSMLLGGGK